MFKKFFSIMLIINSVLCILSCDPLMFVVGILSLIIAKLIFKSIKDNTSAKKYYIALAILYIVAMILSGEILDLFLMILLVPALIIGVAADSAGWIGFWDFW